MNEDGATISYGSGETANLGIGDKKTGNQVEAALTPAERSILVNKFDEASIALVDESERGTAIVGAALLEDALDNLFKKYLVPPTGRQDEIVGAREFSFSMKIDLAHRVGLIRPSIKKALHTVRRIRNDFAHSSASLTFTSPSIRDRVIDLCELSWEHFWAIAIESCRESGVELIRGGSSPFPRALVDTIGARTAFSITVENMYSGLDFTHSQIIPIAPLDCQPDCALD